MTTHTHRKPALRRCLLNILMDFNDDVCPQATLLDHLNMRERPRTSQDDFLVLMGELKDALFIDQISGKFIDDEPCWFITERGLVHIRQS